jgi:hypothetical protein
VLHHVILSTSRRCAASRYSFYVASVCCITLFFLRRDEVLHHGILYLYTFILAESYSVEIMNRTVRPVG